MFSWGLVNFGIGLAGKFAENYHLCIISIDECDFYYD